jgi:hypothetical protein
MAAGLTFWQMPEDQDVFLEYLAKTGNIVAISHFAAVPLRNALRPLPLGSFVGAGDFERLHIFPVEFADAIRIHEFPLSAQQTSPLYAVDTVRSPVLLYTPGTLAEGALSQSNLSTSWTYLDEDKRTVVAKPLRFRKWGEGVLRWLRRVTPEWYGCRGYRCTRMAAGRAKDGVRLVLYHGWSGKHTGNGSFEV